MPKRLLNQHLVQLSIAAIAGFLLVLPLATLEAVNVGIDTNFPVVLFGFLWVLFLTFTFILIPVVRNMLGGERILARPLPAVARLAFLALIGWCLVSLIIDQWPCFLGVPNCD